MTKVLSGSLAAGFISGNTTTMTFNAPVDVLKANSVRMNNTTVLAKTGHNSFLMLQNGIVYTCASNQGTYSSYCLGRGTSYPNNMGYDSLRVVNFPGEYNTGAYVVDANMAGGVSVAYALFSNGNLYTWGNNGNGQCGLGSTSAVYVPTLAATGVTDVYVHPSNGDRDPSYTRLIIRKTDGYLYGAGYNGNYNLGLNDTTQRTTFTQLTGFGNSILNCWNLGSDKGCIVVQKTDYTIWICGYNAFGQLGNGTTTSIAVPTNLTSAWAGGPNLTLKKVTGGFGYYSTGEGSTSWLAMLFTNGTTFRVSGYGGDGVIGNGGTGNVSTPYAPNVGTGIITDIAAHSTGLGSLLCLKSDGVLYAWGRNDYGQLGNGNTTQQNSPVIVTSGVTALMSDCITNTVQGYIACCFIQKADGLYSTGHNAYGALGVGDTTNRSVFTRVLLPPNFVVSQLGWYPTSYPGCNEMIALSTDGRLYAWGYNGAYGVSGEGYNNNITTPIQIRLPLGA